MPGPTGGATFTGQVLSGSGSTYQVMLNPSQGGPTVSATQLQIDPSQTIPAGTFCLVVQVGNAYYMQVPVWLAPA